MKIMRLAAHFRVEDGDVDAWLARIPWKVLKEWLDFVDLEPIGDERDDLRIGALASVIWNTNLDTKKMGGLLKPVRYAAGWTEDRTFVFGVLPNKPITDDTRDNTLNDPVNFANFKTGLIKVYGTDKRS